jgi:phage terminase large subunit-like protein
MANTAIRLGYLSISSGGGGAGFEEYANLAAFPPVGEEDTIYLALDTKKIYVWAGSAYEEISSSEDKANRDLDNLIETSIPDGVGLNSLATSNFNIKTIDKEDSTATVRISSGDSTVAGNSGDIVLSTGEVTSGNKGNIELNSKNIVANVDYYSGFLVRNPSGDSTVDINTTGFGAPDNPQIIFNGVASGGVAAIQAFSRPNNNGGTTYLTSTMVSANADGNYNGGNLNLTAGSNAFEGITADNASVSSGSVNITTSDAFSQGSATDANSGNIVIQTGNKEGSGTRGYVSLSGSHINANLAQIKNVADGTDSNDAINLSQLNSAISPLEGISEVVKFHVFENNAAIYADGMPGIRDTSTLIRDGWYFQNATGQKINWYFFDGNPLSSTYQGAITQANFNAYAVMTLDNKNSNPIMALYSLPTGSGDALPGFAHSRWVYQLSTAALSPLFAGTKYLFYIGTNPPVHPELQHIALDLVPVQSIGDKNPSELILTAALNSSSGEPAGEVSWMVESLGVFSPTRKQEMELRIRTVPLNSASKIDSIYLPSYVDDVLEYANLAAFPITGETGKIYVTLDTNKIYRWSGSVYIEIIGGNPFDQDLNKTDDVEFNSVTTNQINTISVEDFLVNTDQID